MVLFAFAPSQDGDGSIATGGRPRGASGFEAAGITEGVRARVGTAIGDERSDGASAAGELCNIGRSDPGKAMGGTAREGATTRGAETTWEKAAPAAQRSAAGA